MLATARATGRAATATAAATGTAVAAESAAAAAALVAASHPGTAAPTAAVAATRGGDHASDGDVIGVEGDPSVSGVGHGDIGRVDAFADVVDRAPALDPNGGGGVDLDPFK